MEQNTWGISPLGTAFLKKQEGYRSQPYWDHKQWSSGFGTRSQPGEVVDKAEAERRMLSEAGNVSNWLKSNVTTPMNDSQEDALISAGYNLGTGPKGLGRLLGDMNAGNWDSVARRLPTFNKASGQVNEGLINRRAAEVEMLTGRPNTLAQRLGGGAGGYIGGTAAAPSQAAVPGAMPPEALVAPSGRYSKLADALLASAAGAKPKGWGDLLNATGDLALGYSLAGKEDKAQKEYSSKLAQRLSGASTPEALTGALMNSGDPDLMKAGVQAKMQEAQARAKANAPLRGKERFLVTPNGVMDVETNQIVPGTAKPAAATAGKTQEVNGRLIEKQPDGSYKAVYESPPKPTQLTAADRKEIIESDQAAQAGKSAVMGLNKAIGLNDKAYAGPLAETRGWISSLFGSEGGKATEDVNNIITSQALDQLKAVFGGMPTEGERNILLQIQGSTKQAPAVRKAIWERGIDMAERRIAFNQQQSQALRSGEYYQPGFSPVTPDAAPPQPAAAASPEAPKRIATPEEYQAIPSGTRFVDPEGNVRIKP